MLDVCAEVRGRGCFRPVRWTNPRGGASCPKRVPRSGPGLFPTGAVDEPEGRGALPDACAEVGGRVCSRPVRWTNRRG